MRGRLFLSCIAAAALSALLLASGAHWVLLQGLAWTQMLADYSRSDSIAAAVAKTFDGKHPCRLCHRVVKESTGDRELPASVDPAQKVGFFLAPPTADIAPPCGRDRDFPASRLRGPGDLFFDPPCPVPEAVVS